MKLLQLLTATSRTNIGESIQQVYQTMQVVAEVEKFDKFFNDAREAWVGGIADFGDPQAAIQMQQHPQYDVYRESLDRAVSEHLGDPFVAYRLMSKDQIEEWQSGADMPAIAVSTELSIAKAFRKLAANRGRDDLQVVQLSVPADAVIMLGHSREHELVVDANYISANEIGFLSESLSESILMELQQIGDPSQMTSRELKEKLEDAGWAKIDDGDTAYSNVYGKPGDPWVVKILKVSRLGKASTRFQCAMQWYRYCLKNWQGNPHLPRIPFVKTLQAEVIGDDGVRRRSKDHRTYAVMIERLDDFYVNHYEWRREDPLDNAIMFSVMAAVAGIYDHSWMNEEDVQKVFPTLLRMLPEEDLMLMFNSIQQHAWVDDSFEFGSEEWFASFSKALLQHGGFSELGSMMEKGIEVGVKYGNPMAIAMEQIHKAGEDNGCEIDLHLGNVMVRPSTGELVITDPVQG